MKYWSIIILLAVIISCSKDDLNDNPCQTFYELMQGNWILEEIDSSAFSNAFSLTVNDSLFHLFSQYSDSVNYKLKDSIITVYNATKPEYIGKIQKFKILNLDKDRLELVALSVKWNEFMTNIQYPYADTLRFLRITEKNQIDPIKIGFSSTGCFGTCPSMKLEIDNKRNVKFFGGNFSEIEGGYKGRIPANMYDQILKQLRSIPLESLKSEYVAPWTDDQTRYLYVETSDTIITVKSYGDYKQPYELTIIYSNLMDAYKRLDLIQDSTIDSRFSFQKHLMMSYPIPPPPMED